MTNDDKKQPAPADKPAAKPGDIHRPEKRLSGGRRMGGRRRGPDSRQDTGDEYEQRILDIARVTRVMAGGKRMRFRACVAIGNRKGKVGVGIAKGADVTFAVAKAVTEAKKDMVEVPIYKDTIPHEVRAKLGAARIIFKPAAMGRGVIAGGAVRLILELAGIKNITSKILGTNNKINNAKCVIAALRTLKRVERPVAPKPEAEAKVSAPAELK